MVHNLQYFKDQIIYKVKFPKHSEDWPPAWDSAVPIGFFIIYIVS